MASSCSEYIPSDDVSEQMYVDFHYETELSEKPSPTRKRSVNKELWKKTKRKTLKAKGKRYDNEKRASIQRKTLN